MQENHEKQNSRTIPSTDHVVDSVIDKFIERAQFGREKYGVGLERTDLNFLDYCKHLREELMDGILYLEKMEKIIREQNS
jgi:hypothetical protein